jgi:deoxycytidylate deaminase
MTKNSYHLDWSDLAFGSKQGLKDLQAIFIVAPREMSARRFKQLIKDYLPKGNLVFGMAQEDYVLGLELQPQFATLRLESVKPIIDKVNTSASANKVYTLTYSQRDITYILEKANFKRVILVNGSWYRAFHRRPEYYTLVKNHITYEMVSPFFDEQEAKQYPETVTLPSIPKEGYFSQSEIIELVDQSAKHSYDYGASQTGAVLGLKENNKYKLLATAHNEIIPYETYAMHFGSSREKNFSPLHDLNHYDTNHAEVGIIVAAQKHKLDLSGSTLFINLLPCPTCARMLVTTDIAEFVYSEDHSSGYAANMLESAGKKVRRLIRK